MRWARSGDAAHRSLKELYAQALHIMLTSAERKRLSERTQVSERVEASLAVLRRIASARTSGERRFGSAGTWAL